MAISFGPFHFHSAHSFFSFLFIFFSLLLRMKNQIYFQSTTHFVCLCFFSSIHTRNCISKNFISKIKETIIFVVARFLFICRIKLFSSIIFLPLSFFLFSPYLYFCMLSVDCIQIISFDFSIGSQAYNSFVYSVK